MTPVLTLRRRGALAVMGGALVLSACAASPPEEVESEGVVPVRTATATTGSIRGVVYATGVVVSAPGAELVVVAPEVARIAEITHAEGDRVSRGDLLVRFEVPHVLAEVERQTAEVRRARTDLATLTAAQSRSRALFDRGVASRQVMEEADRQAADAQAVLTQAEAARVAAEALAARATVYATFDGLVAQRFHDPGDVVEASAIDPVLRVIDPRRVEVMASVPLADAARVVFGASARLASTSAEAGGALRVVSRPAGVEPGTATVPVRLLFDGPSLLPAGTPVDVIIEADARARVVLVPVEAIVREGGAAAVFVVRDGMAERREVETGLTDGAFVELRAGVNRGDEVVVDGHTELLDGSAVAATPDVEEEPPAAGARP